jgi:hypothetical protein
MKSPYCFIIKAVDGRRYDNIRTYGENEFIISTSQEDHTVSNRFAEVVSVPIYYNGPITTNDIVVVHHNVFKFYYDMKGRQKSSWHHLKDDLFIVEPEQVYLHSQNGNDWEALSPFCFIKPIPSEDKIFSPLSGFEELWGEVVFKNDDMTEVEVGDIVSFTPDSEYEFRINNEILYRMYNRNICLKK